MTTQEICQRLQTQGIEAEYKETTPDDHIVIPRESLTKAAEYLRDDPECAFVSLMCLSGVEQPEHLESVCQLLSYKHGHRVTIKVACPKDDPIIPTVSKIWPTAEWHEREAYDLIGIRYDGNSDLRRILLPEDWEGHPLRKDYVPPEKWHDIPVTTVLPQSTDD